MRRNGNFTAAYKTMFLFKKKTFWVVLMVMLCLILASCGGEISLDPAGSSEDQTESKAESLTESVSAGEENSGEETDVPDESSVSGSTEGSGEPVTSEDEPAVSEDVSSAVADSSEDESEPETSGGDEDPVEPSRPEESSEAPSRDPVEESSKPSGETSVPEECKHTSTKWTTTKEAGCETEGQRQETCKSCGKTLRTETIPAKTHSYLSLIHI